MNGNLKFQMSDLPTHIPSSSTISEDEVKFDSGPAVEDKEEAKEKVADVIKGTVAIQGTTITLESEEDIARWIEERKKRWPTKKNIDLKMKEKQQLQKTEAERRGHLIRTNKTDDRKNICRFYQRNKTCRYGNRCKNSHDLGLREIESQDKSIGEFEISIPRRFDNEMNDPSLFKRLTRKEHFENENSLIIEFIQFLDKQGVINHEILKRHI